MIIRFYTDGACSGNPGPGGYACIIIQRDERPKIISNGKEQTTNNEMELLAVLKSLEYVYDNGIHKTKHRAEIYSDSAYVVNSINQKWYIGWANNHWTTKKGSPVKNVEIWKKIYNLMRVINARVIKVKGHDGDKYNEMADKAARGEILKLKTE